VGEFLDSWKISLIKPSGVASSSVASPKLLSGAKYFDLNEQQYFICDTPSQSAERQEMLEICPLTTPIAARGALGLQAPGGTFREAVSC